MTKFPPDLSPTGKARLLTEELFKATKAYLEADKHLQHALDNYDDAESMRDAADKMSDAKHAYLNLNEADILRMSGLEIVNGRYVKAQ